jgi:rare lipoprotein A
VDALRPGSLVWGVALVLALAAGCARPRPAPWTGPAPVGYEETGRASWYGVPYHGRRAASGEVYDMNQMTAAHRTLPFGTWLAVENLDNHRTVEVRVNDRGPFVDERILDLSRAAAQILGVTGPGVIAGPTARPPAEARAFSVQVGAFSTEDRAEALRRELDGAGVDAGSVQAAELGGRTIYRVRVGRFGGRAEAEAQARRLAALGYAVLVVAAE